MTIAINSSGGLHDTAPFPIGEKVATSDVDYSALLGMEVRGLGGEVYRLVRLDNASGIAAGAVEARAFDWNAEATYDVDLTGSAVAPCGISVPGQVALADNDFFWLQVEGRCKVTDSGSGVTAADYLQCAAAGECVTDGTVAAADHLSGSTFGIAITTTAADGQVPVRLLKRLR